MTTLHPSTHRAPAVAGFFYPDDAQELARTVDAAVARARHRGATGDRPPFALVVPHAGYAYSAAIAAEAYALLPRIRDQIHRVLLLGPAHRVGFRGLAAPSVETFRTPLGDIAIDKQAVAALSRLPQVAIRDDAHAQEHSLEVQLPFLQRALGTFELIPLVVGAATADDVAEVIAVMTAEPGTLVVVSSDLSHYHSYEHARALDRQTIDAILALDSTAIADEGACGRIPIKGLLTIARANGAKPDLLDLRNSGDTAGDKDRVVGYAALCFRDDEGGALNRSERDALLHVAEVSIDHGLAQGSAARIDATAYAAALGADGASFVTLKTQGRLRGCIGSLLAHRPLVIDVAENAFAAAFRDPRFEPLRAEERDAITTLEISVLSAPQPLVAPSRNALIGALRPGVDGLIVQEAERRATFLPQVWQQLCDRDLFVNHLWQKAGLEPDHWSGTLRFWTYQTQSFARARRG